MSERAKTWIVVPCYNEETRLRAGDFERFAGEHPDIGLLFVDDGSTDRTLAQLEELASRSAAIQVMSHSPNRGKGEAVRRGMLQAFEAGAVYVGYWDADLATPLSEIPRFIETLDEHPELAVLFGARVQLLGRTIERRASRHYLGRVGATAISLAIGMAVYDTQCGAKLFRVSRENEELFAVPFHSRWLFDVEIIARMKKMRRASGQPEAAEVIREIPLHEWHDTPGSKVRPLDFLRSLFELIQIRRRYRDPA
jgi:dolichyl-phosphate beta-glucosyltransferase